jgi:hypothetical protein
LRIAGGDAPGADRAVNCCNQRTAVHWFGAGP